MPSIVCTVTTDITFDQRMHRICSSLVNNGFDVLLIGRKLNNSLPLQPQIYGQKRISMIFKSGFLMYAEFNFKLFLKLLFTKADVINAVDLDTLFPATFVSKLKNCKVIYDAHEYFTELPTVVNKKNVKKVWQYIAAFCIPKVDAAYTVGSEIANELSKLYETQFDVIRNTPYLTESEIVENDKNDKNDKYILYQGVVKEGRALKELVLALKNTNYTLKIAGEGKLLNALKSLVKVHRLEKRIVFFGNLKPEELKKVTRNAWIGINPLENLGKSYYFSLSNKFFDYIHAEIPQICMRFPEYESINKLIETSIMIQNVNETEIVEALKKLEDGQTYFKLKQNCNNSKKIYNWQNEEKKLLSIYRNCCKN